MRAFAEHYPAGINLYVPAMGYHSDVYLSGPTEIDLGTPLVSDADGIFDGQVITTTGGTFDSTYESDARYGRNILVKGNTAGDNAVVTVVGTDYLGQPMREEFTLSGIGSIVGDKAFYRVESVITSANAQASNVDVGWGTKLGLPFKVTKVLAEIVNEVDGTIGTFAAPDLTDPATATTGDPRGTYVPSSTPDGSKRIVLSALCSSWLNDSGNGGLHGIKHFGG